MTKQLDLENLPETRVIGEDGRWHKCKPFVATVKGGRAVIYTDDKGNEIKREPLARYTARALKELQG